MEKHILILLLLLLMPLFSTTQSTTDSRIRIDTTTWKKATEGIEFEPLVRQKRQVREPSGISPFWESFLKILSVLAVIGLVLLILKNVLDKNILSPKNTRFDPIEDLNLQEVADRLDEFSSDDLIASAIRQEDYPAATRLYYLSVIRKLSEKNWIKWKKNKTNLVYQQELSSKQPRLSSQFSWLTRTFENIWYGERHLSASDFDKVKELFISFLNKIQ